MFAEPDIGVLSVDDRIADVYLHLVGPGGNVQHLRAIVAYRCRTGLRSIHEHY
jgi:hypothetical protein